MDTKKLARDGSLEVRPRHIAKKWTFLSKHEKYLNWKFLLPTQKTVFRRNYELQRISETIFSVASGIFVLIVVFFFGSFLAEQGVDLLEPLLQLGNPGELGFELDPFLIEGQERAAVKDVQMPTSLTVELKH